LYMSTPSGKPSHSIVPDDPERDGPERTAAELELAASANASPPSQYIPKRARQHPGTRRHSAGNDTPFLQVVVDWKRAKDATAAAAMRSAGTQASRHANAAHDGAEVPIGEQQVLDAVEQAVDAARKAINESPFEQCVAKVIDEADVENLEASLRWLQRRQAAAVRLPPAPKLPPVSRRVPPQFAADKRLDKRVADPFRISPRTLEPTLLTLPPTQSHRHPNMMLAVSIGCALLAGLIYYFLETDRWSSSKTTSHSQIAYVIPQPPSAIDANQWVQPEPSPSALNIDQEPPAEAQKPAQPIATAAIIAPQIETTAVRSPPPPAPAANDDDSPPGKASRTLDPEVIALLIKEAEKHMSTGDVVTARMIFGRAAKAGDATATLALAATYDPMMLAKLGVMGMGADLEKARAWYRMAESFGSVEAKQRLRSLDRQ
jgi:hypothetical protein